MLTQLQVTRYVRQLLLPEIGPSGQERLTAASLDLPGEGLAASTAREYLSRAGVNLTATSRAPAVGGLRCALSETGFAWSTAGSPCEACLKAWVDSLPSPPSNEQTAVAMAAGALAASQLMLAPLGLLKGSVFGRGVGYALWPTLVRREIGPRAGCLCRTVVSG